MDFLSVVCIYILSLSLSLSLSPSFPPSFSLSSLSPSLTHSLPPSITYGTCIHPIHLDSSTLRHRVEMRGYIRPTDMRTRSSHTEHLKSYAQPHNKINSLLVARSVLPYSREIWQFCEKLPNLKLPNIAICVYDLYWLLLN